MLAVVPVDSFIGEIRRFRFVEGAIFVIYGNPALAAGIDNPPGFHGAIDLDIAVLPLARELAFHAKCFDIPPLLPVHPAKFGA